MKNGPLDKFYIYEKLLFEFQSRLARTKKQEIILDFLLSGLSDYLNEIWVFNFPENSFFWPGYGR